MVSTKPRVARRSPPARPTVRLDGTTFASVAVENHGNLQSLDWDSSYWIYNGLHHPSSDYGSLDPSKPKFDPRGIRWKKGDRYGVVAQDKIGAWHDPARTGLHQT